MDRWKTTDEKLKEMLKKYNKLNKRTQDKIQEVFDGIDFNGQNLFDIASKRTLDKVNRKIEEYTENNEINDYTRYRINKIYGKSRIRNNEVLDFLIFICFLEERNKLTEYENEMFHELSNVEYEKAQKEVYDLKKEDKKVTSISSATYNKLLSSPNPKGYIWDEYILATLLFNSEQIYRQALIELRQNKVLDITNDIYQNILKAQRNRYLSIKDGDITSGDLELQTLYMVNSSIKEGYIKADNNAKVRFIAEIDKRTTDMCESLNNQIFSVNDWNTYQRWSAADDRMVVYKTFGLEVGANLPPINNHFHWCRSTITYNIDYTDIKKGDNKESIAFRESKGSINDISNETVANNGNILNKKIAAKTDEVYNKYLENGYENLSLITKDGGKRIGEISNIKSKTGVDYSEEQIRLMNQYSRELIAIHNHPGNHTFSLEDIYETFKNESLCGIIVRTDDYNYYFMPKREHLDVTNKNLLDFSRWFEERLGNVNDEMLTKYPNKSSNELQHLSFEKIFGKMEWDYGREKVNK